MQKITNKQYEEYRRLIYDRDHGRMLTPDGLRLICSACNYDPTEIGKIMLENLANLQAKGAVSMHPGQEVDPEADNDEV
ncbi:MAG: cytochrome C [Lachnospiraceae bacterium]|jgi:hypothetical protein|nr:cytochrome C [Lachnospiraceae bacterium]MCH4027941.1 cytochrome C [Lachnospiraceae bacterium]MCH4065785.1 cytochrome C [Lachnospiraceae bacterium]MCH4111821.1 cytochrome C [Lachnospiraceae bacterium]